MIPILLLLQQQASLPGWISSLKPTMPSATIAFAPRPLAPTPQALPPAPVQFKLTNVRCANILLGNLESAVDNTPGGVPALTVTFDGIAIDCAIEAMDIGAEDSSEPPTLALTVRQETYDGLAALPDVPTLSDITLTVGNVAGTIVLELPLDAASGLPAGLVAPRVDISIGGVQMAVGTGFVISDFIVSGFIDLLAGILSPLISESISAELEAVLAFDISTTIAELSSSLAPAVEQRAREPFVAAPEPDFGAGALDWTSHEGVVAAADSLSASIRLGDGTTAEAAEMLNRGARAAAVLLDSATELGDDTLSTPPLGTVALESQDAGAATYVEGSIVLGPLHIKGLSTFSSLLLSLVDKSSVHVSASLDSLRLVTVLTAELRPQASLAGVTPGFDCNCAWTDDYACPAAAEAGIRGYSVDDGSECFSFCCPPQPYLEELEVAVGFANLAFDALFAVGVNASDFGDARLGDVAANPRCLLADLEGVSARRLGFRLAPTTVELIALGVGNVGLETQIGNLASNILGFLSAAMGDGLPAMIDALVGTDGKKALNDLLAADVELLRDAAGGHCDGDALERGIPLLMSAPAANDYVAWRDVPSLVAASDSLSDAGALNTALRHLGGATFSFPFKVGSLTLEAPLATPLPITISVANVSMTNLDSFYHLDLLNLTCGAGEASQFCSGAGLGGVGKPFSLTASMEVASEKGARSWDIEVHMSNAEYRVAEVVYVLAEVAAALPLKEMITPCAFEPLRGIDIATLTAAANAFEVTLRGSSTGWDQFAYATEEFGLATLNRSVVQGLVEPLLPGGIALANRMLNEGLATAHAACDRHRSGVDLAAEAYALEVARKEEIHQKHELEAQVLIAIYAIAAIAVIAIIGGHLLEYACRPRSSAPTAAVGPYSGSIASAFGRGGAAALSLALLLTVGAFIWSSTQIGAAVLVTVVVGGQPLPPMEAFRFALAESTVNFWATGWSGYPIAIMVVLFSGVWPYVKLLSTVFALWAPPAVLPIRTRGRLLYIFEALGKWSLVDALMTFVLMAANRFDIILPPGGAADGGSNPLVVVHVEVKPENGLLLFTLGAVVSLFLTGMASHMHKTAGVAAAALDGTVSRGAVKRAAAKAQADASATKKAAAGVRTTDADFNFQTVEIKFDDVERADVDEKAPRDVVPRISPGPHATLALCRAPDALQSAAPARALVAEPTVTSSLWKRRLVTLGLVLGFVLTATAAALPVYALHVTGLAGNLLGDKASAEYSVITGGITLYDSSPSTSPFIMRSLQILYFFLILIVPLFHYATSLLAWLRPCSLATRHHQSFVLQLLYSFSVVDVYLVTLVLSLIELDAIAQQMLEGKCDVVETALATEFSAFMGGSPKCFGVTPEILPAFSVLALGALFGMPAAGCVASAIDRSVDEAAEHTRSKSERAGLPGSPVKGGATTTDR